MWFGSFSNSMYLWSPLIKQLMVRFVPYVKAFYMNHVKNSVDIPTYGIPAVPNELHSSLFFQQVMKSNQNEFFLSFFVDYEEVIVLRNCRMRTIHVFGGNPWSFSFYRKIIYITK